jgi:hypothetical protein
LTVKSHSQTALTRFFLLFILVVSSLKLVAQAPSISVPDSIIFTQGIENTPVKITNTGGEVPNKVYGQAETVAQAALTEGTGLLIKSPDGYFYGKGFNTPSIYKISAAGVATLYAGSSTSGYIDGKASEARL